MRKLGFKCATVHHSFIKSFGYKSSGEIQKYLNVLKQSIEFTLPENKNQTNNSDE